jgi:DNA-binding CsgD family transcriptional regulator
MSTCQELADIRRAAEWTGAIAHWWSRFPATGPFLGICRAHRAEVFQLQGAWDQAEHEANLVCTRLTHFSVSGLAAAHYQLGELARLKGDLTGAEESYRQSHHYGRDPQPGYALLRLAQGQPDLAHSSIQAAISAQSHDRLAQARLRPAEIEIALVRGDLETARRAQAHLEDIASIYKSGGLIAAALTARGSVLLHEGESADALPTLRSACLCWQELSAPFETARVRLLLARAYHSLGDVDAARREEEAAAITFAKLGLASQRATFELDASSVQRADGLTPREIDILREVAVGKTNREIADELYISQKTVARHLSNIFVKLELSSRTAAAAYAFEQGLTA